MFWARTPDLLFQQIKMFVFFCHFFNVHWINTKQIGLVHLFCKIIMIFSKYFFHNFCGRLDQIRLQKTDFSNPNYLLPLYLNHVIILHTLVPCMFHQNLLETVQMEYKLLSTILRLYTRAHGAKLISYNSLVSNTLSQSMTMTTVLQAGLYIMGCPDVLRSVAGCGNPPLSKAGQLVQQ